MLTKLFPQNTLSQPPNCNEGDLFKRLQIEGREFEIYYGYYEDIERENPLVEPMPIYPDFLKEPQYTADGFPFVTKMQDACEHYKGNKEKFKECAECEYYKHCEDLIGVCTNLNRKE